MDYRNGCVECTYHKIRHLFGEPERLGADWCVEVWHIGTFDGVDHFLSDDEFRDCDDVPIFSVISRTWIDNDDIETLYTGDIVGALKAVESLQAKHMTDHNPSEN